MGALVKWGWVCAIAGVAFFIFASTFSNPFLHDDIAIIGENPLVRESGRILEAFRHDYWAVLETNERRDRLYRPLTITSLALNHALGGLNPVGYRVVNALFHVLACLALFWLCIRFGLSRNAAGAVSLLFALHPVHTEAVNAVVARADLMAAVGVFGGLGLLMGVALPVMNLGEAQESRENAGDGGFSYRDVLAPIALTCALCLFALLSKEIGVALLFSALLWWFWGRYVLRETERPPLRHTLIGGLRARPRAHRLRVDAIRRIGDVGAPLSPVETRQHAGADAGRRTDFRRDWRPGPLFQTPGLAMAFEHGLLLRADSGGRSGSDALGGGGDHGFSGVELRRLASEERYAVDRLRSRRFRRRVSAREQFADPHGHHHGGAGDVYPLGRFAYRLGAYCGRVAQWKGLAYRRGAARSRLPDLRSADAQAKPRMGRRASFLAAYGGSVSQTARARSGCTGRP